MKLHCKLVHFATAPYNKLRMLRNKSKMMIIAKKIIFVYLFSFKK